jgi:hypothetical protein
MRFAINARSAIGTCLGLFCLLYTACGDASCPAGYMQEGSTCKAVPDVAATAGALAQAQAGVGEADSTTSRAGTAGSATNTQGTAGQSSSILATSGSAAIMSMAGGRGVISTGIAGSAAGTAAGAGGMSNVPTQPGCSPVAEECDSRDNDCDGKVDETLEMPCGMSSAGICRMGKKTCTAGAWNACTGAIDPAKEMCDAAGLDENCDGTANEGCSCTPGQTQDCGSALGICKQGKQTCNAGGQWGSDCAGGVKPKAAEICDGTNDDTCDGNVDEGCACTNGATMACAKAPGICDPGTKTCVNGMWSAQCDNKKPGTTETCNGIDDDCDGMIDDSAPCPTGQTCSAGECTCSSAAGCPQPSNRCMTATCNSGTCGATTIDCSSGMVCNPTRGGCERACGNGQVDRALGESCDTGIAGADTWACDKDKCTTTGLGFTAYNSCDTNLDCASNEECIVIVLFGAAGITGSLPGGRLCSPMCSGAKCTVPPGYTIGATSGTQCAQGQCNIRCSSDSDCPHDASGRGIACQTQIGYCQGSR